MTAEIKKFYAKRGPEHARMLRIHVMVYDELKRLKGILATIRGNRRVTYSEIMMEAIPYMRAAVGEDVIYEVNGTLYYDILDARGAAIERAIKGDGVIHPPNMLIKIGVDDLGRTETGDV